MPYRCGGEDEHVIHLDAEPSPAEARGALRRDAAGADYRRHIRARAAVEWEKMFVEHVVRGTGPATVVDVAPLDPRVVPASAAAWARHNPKP